MKLMATTAIATLTLALMGTVQADNPTVRVRGPVGDLANCIGLGGPEDIAKRTDPIPGLIPIFGLSNSGDGLWIDLLGNSANLAYMDFTGTDASGLEIYIFTGTINDNTVQCARRSACEEQNLESLHQWMDEVSYQVANGMVVQLRPPELDVGPDCEPV
jgi:hypothetical protein